MNLALSPEMQKFIRQKVKAGQYATPEEVVRAAVSRLMQQDHEPRRGEFDPGELDALVAVGESDIKRGAVSDGDEVFSRLRRKGAEFRRKQRRNGRAGSTSKA